METSTNLSIKPVILKTITGYEFFEYSEIIRFEASRKVTLVYTTNNLTEPIIALCSISTIETLLPVNLFYRCHRSHIINTEHIKKFFIKSNQLVMVNGNEIPVAEDNIKLFKEKVIYRINSEQRNYSQHQTYLL